MGSFLLPGQNLTSSSQASVIARRSCPMYWWTMLDESSNRKNPEAKEESRSSQRLRKEEHLQSRRQPWRLVGTDHSGIEVVRKRSIVYLRSELLSLTVRMPPKYPPFAVPLQISSLVKLF